MFICEIIHIISLKAHCKREQHANFSHTPRPIFHTDVGPHPRPLQYEDVLRELSNTLCCPYYQLFLRKTNREGGDTIDTTIRQQAIQ